MKHALKEISYGQDSDEGEEIDLEDESLSSSEDDGSVHSSDDEFLDDGSDGEQEADSTAEVESKEDL